MLIRQAASEDSARMASLLTQLGYPTDSTQVAQQLGETTSGDKAHVLVAEQSGKLVAVAVVHVIAPLHVRSPWALLSALVVDEGHRGSGVGAALLRGAEAFAAKLGCSQLELSSNLARTRTHEFYERNGYQERRVRFVKSISA